MTNKLYKNGMEMDLVYGVVVLYNPTFQVLENIKTYINSLDKLLLVDNSECIDEELKISLLEFSNKMVYISMNGNKGISAALNKAIRVSFENSVPWLLTMDQDSAFVGDSFARFVIKLDRNDTTYGLFASVPVIGNNVEHIEFKDIVLTSGNIVNVATVFEVGMFNEELFIDYVDVDFCLRLKEKHKKVFFCDDIHLQHNLGEFQKNMIASFTNHNAIRRYYISRNRFYVWNKYKRVDPIFIKHDQMCFFKETIKIIFFEKDKFKKMHSILRGYIDYKKGQWGKYEP